MDIIVKTSSPQPLHKRRTIGLIIDWVGTNYHKKLVAGATGFCAEHNLNLVCFITGRLASDLESEYCRNAIFGLIPTVAIDGFIISAASLSNVSGIQALEKVLRESASIPTVTIGARLGTNPFISVADNAGIRLLLDHALVVHGYRRFAFIRGPVLNPEAETRYKAFCDFMAEHGLTINPDLVYQGDFRYASGVDAGRYLDSRRAHWDVIISANDPMAAGALEVLGTGTRIMGFDNLDAADRYSLTSIDARPDQLMRHALEQLVQVIENPSRVAQEIPAYTCSLVVRNSCGCQKPNPAFVDSSHNTVEEVWLDRTNDIGESILTIKSKTELDIWMSSYLPKMHIHLWQVDQNPRELVPHAWLTGNRRVEIVVHALFIGRELLGFAAFDMSSHETAQLEWLRHHISLVFRLWVPASQETPPPAANTFSELPVWVIEVDQRHNIRTTNAAAEKFLAAKEAAMFGHNIIDMVVPEERQAFLGILQGLGSGNDSNTCEIRLQNSLGERIPLLCKIQAFSNSTMGTSTASGVGLQPGKGFRLSGFNLKPFLESMVSPAEHFFRQYYFTWREKEIITGLLEGKDIQDLAQKIGISPNTVKGYMHQVYIKTGVSGKKDFLRLANQYQASPIGPKSFMHNLLASLLGS